MPILSLCLFCFNMLYIVCILSFQVWRSWAETEFAMWCSEERQADSWRQTERAGRENQTAAGETWGFAGTSSFSPLQSFTVCVHQGIINYFYDAHQKTSTIKSAADVKKLPLEVSMKPTESSSQVQTPSYCASCSFINFEAPVYPIIYFYLASFNVLIFFYSLYPLYH